MKSAESGQNLPKKFSFAEAKLKAASFCAYQERCQEEVRSKLYDYGLSTPQLEELLSYLITENFINEERFAKAYSGGKFRIKKWGRLRIQRELQKRKISDYCIRKGFMEIDDVDYQETLKSIILTKGKQIDPENRFQFKNKIARYAINKGYEPFLVWELVNQEFK